MRMVMTCMLMAMAAGIGACASGEKPHTTEAFSPVGQWRLIAIQGERVDPPEGARQPTLTIREDGSVGGSAGINRYSGALDTEAWREGRWVMSPVITTRMGGTPAAMDFEQRYLEHLTQVDAFVPGSTTLDLMGDDAFMLRFDRVDD